MSVNKYDPQTKQLIPIAGQAAPVKADGVTFPSRAAVNFVDHTVRDNPENDETDILPYELTDEDMENIMENPPVNPTSMPILFDETGAEHQVGWYVLSDGTKKPLYQKTVVTTSPSAVNTDTVLFTGDPNLDIKTVGGYITLNIASSNIIQHIPVNWIHGNICITTYIGNNLYTVKQHMSTETYLNCPVTLTIQYTKTTDIPV